MEKQPVRLQSKHNGRPFEADANYRKDGKKKPVIIFNHGFKGFKDWGSFNLVAERFASEGFVFVKMNFSHNGVSIEHPLEFADLEAFAQNNFSIELDDTGVLIDYLCSDRCAIPVEEIDLEKLYIIGHSRGGASAILKSSEDSRIKSVITWAAVNDLETWHSKEEIEYWKTKGRIYIHNSRTNQEMPMDFQLVEDFQTHRDRLLVPDAVKKMAIPMLALHGSADTTVPVKSVEEIGSWNESVKVKIIENADHTFGGGHPFEGDTLPKDLSEVIDHTISFLNNL